MRAALAVTAMVAGTVLAGCSTSASDLPLPGTTVSGESFEIDARFVDALNLAVGAKVKVNGIDVGKVKVVTADDFAAIAVLRVQEDANIYRGATARLRYTTPLGELFVDIQSPREGTLLREGDELTPPETSTAPTVEDALASASLLVNGGGLEQLQTITREFDAAVGERGPVLRQLLDRTDEFLTQANATTGEIDRVLTSLAGASVVLNQRSDIINRAVREIRPSARVLRQNTDELVALLQEVVVLGRKANGIIDASKDPLLRTIRQLGPVLDSFFVLRGEFNAGLRALAGAGAALDDLVKGDAVPLNLGADLAAADFGLNRAGAGGAQAGQAGQVAQGGAAAGQHDGVGSLLGVLGLDLSGLAPGLREGDR